MLFTDPRFIFLFLPLSCAAFYLASHRLGRSAGLSVLLFTSLLFYAQFGLHNFFLLTASVVINFVVSAVLQKAKDSKARSILYWAGQGWNFGALLFYKYNFAALFTDTPDIGNLFVYTVAIPIGISFYTFQQAVFLNDALHRKAIAQVYIGPLQSLGDGLRGFLHYAVFILFIPHRIAGPILYIEEFAPQVEGRKFGRIQRSNIEAGLALFAIGLFKKLVIADSLLLFVNVVYATVSLRGVISPQTALLAGFAFYFQLYFDFSGYADMAQGIARLFGLRYPINFYSPLKADGIVEFYRRWHITLTRMIARFVFTPLSLAGTRFAIRKRLPKPLSLVLSLGIPLLINFEVIALWHGTVSVYFLFGIIHGTWYVLETTLVKKKKARSSFIAKAARHVFFTLAMMLTFALFRSGTIENFIYLLSCMFGSDFYADIPARSSAMYLLPAIVVAWLLPNSSQLLQRYRPGIFTYAYSQTKGWLTRYSWRPDWKWSLATGLIFAVASYYSFHAGLAGFIYMGF